MRPTPGWQKICSGCCQHWLDSLASLASSLVRKVRLAGERTQPNGAEIRGSVRGETKMSW